MYKISICVVMLFHSIAMQAAKIELAKIENNIVELSTHYRLMRGGKTLVYDQSAQPVEVVSKPKALFYGYNSQENKSTFLGAVEVDALDKPTIEYLNQLIDPHVSLPVIKTAIIGYCLKRGRIVRFYDQQGNVINSSSHYQGSVDIKAEEDNIGLIKPHSLLQQLEMVTESVPRPWYLAMLGMADTEDRMVYDNK